MATLNFNCEALEKRMNEGMNISVSGLSLSVEIEINELPDLIKEMPSVISSISNATEKANSHEWEKICSEVNEAKDKLRESERDKKAVEAKAEMAEKRAQRLSEEIHELQKKLDEKENADPFVEARKK